jgi:hypothetical protein
MSTENIVDVLQARDVQARRPTHPAEEDHIVSLSFKVSWEFRQHFKISAAHRGLTMTELLRRAFEALEQKERQERSLHAPGDVHIWK